MKSKSQIEKHLDKIYNRYLYKYVEKSQTRTFKNCLFNECHEVRPLSYQRDNQETEIIPARYTFVVSIKDNNKKIHLCMFNANKASWGGNICDSDEIAKSCKLFKCLKTKEEAIKEFEQLLMDDKYTHLNFPDIAVLQWVLDNRVHIFRYTLKYRILYWWKQLILAIRLKLIKTDKPTPRLEPPDLPEDLWDDPNENSRS